MRNLKKSFGLFNNLIVENVKFIAKDGDHESDGSLGNSLNVFLATDLVVYRYSYFNNELNQCCDFTNTSDVICGILYNDITNCLIVCSIYGAIFSYQFEYGFQVDSKSVAEYDDEFESAVLSPDGEIFILSSSRHVYVFTSTCFDLVCKIKPDEATISEMAQVNVGWGRKETQFHGSEGKAAATKSKPVIESGLIDDDHKTQVSWRGDSQLFSVSYWDSSCNRRFIKMFDKEGFLLAINEELTGLTGPISWRPFGDLLAYSERTPQHYSVGFMEKNGLKHGDFSIPTDYKIKELLWNSDSSILATVCTKDTLGVDFILLWTTCNYHWYLKQTIEFTSTLESVLWDDVRRGRLYGVTGDSCVFVIEWISTVDSNKEWCLNSDSGYVAVIDTNSVLLTAFKEAIVPPPMSQWSIPHGGVNSVLFPSWSEPDKKYDRDDILCTVSNNNMFKLWKREDNQFTIKEEFEIFHNDSRNDSSINASLDHWLWFKPNSFATVQNISFSDSIMKVYKKDNGKFKMTHMKFGFCVISLHYLEKVFLIQSSVGKLYKISEEDLNVIEVLSLAEPCHRLDYSPDGIYSLSDKYRLYKNSVQIASQINSFLIHGSFLLATTSQHTLSVFNHFSEKCEEITKRVLENGSRLIVATKTTAIFQLPRGNLEAIQPRPLIIQTAGRLLDNNRFDKAISLLIRQRIDLNLVVDHNSKHFLESVNEFVCQVDPKWLTLLITELKGESVTKGLYADFYQKDHVTLAAGEKIEKVCNALSTAMSEDVNKYILPIMGSYVKLGRTSEALHLASTDEILQHLIFLVGVDKLYNKALLAYNLEKALKIAGKSQKDPKEYLPYLNKLRQMNPNYMKYSIDKSFGKHESALKHIAACEGDAAFKECLQLVKDYSLYILALNIFLPQTNYSKYKIIAEHFGDYLVNMKKFGEAGIMYKRCGAIRKAIQAYMKRGEWRECLELSNQAGYSDKEKEEMFQVLKGVMKGQQKYEDAGRLCLEVFQDIPGCVDMFILGKLWKEASQVAKAHGEETLIDEIKKSLLDHSEALLNELKNSEENFSKHLSRLQIVRENKNNATGAEVCLADPWDGQSDTSSLASSNRSSVSRSSKNSRKAMRKMWSLKEGNPREEQGLVSTLTSLYESIEKMSFEVNKTCFALLEFELDNVAVEIHRLNQVLNDTMIKSKNSIWPGCLDVDEVTAMDEKLKYPPQSSIMDNWEIEMLK